MPHATNTEHLDFSIFVFNLTLNLDVMVSNFLTSLHVSLAKLFFATNLDLNILFNNEDIAIFVKSDLDLSSRSRRGDRS
jgi:hypothetical protein